LSLLFIQDVNHTGTEGDQHIRDHSSMAAPPEARAGEPSHVRDRFNAIALENGEEEREGAS
jgi:hypothetical protein